MNDIWHMTEIAEWTPELAAEIANIKLDPRPENEMIFWSLPKGSGYLFTLPDQPKEGAD